MLINKPVFKSSILSDLSLLLATMIWGAGFVATQMALDSGFSFCLILLIRFLIASVVLFCIFRKELHDFTKEELIYGGVTGLILFLAFYSQTVGLKYTTPSNNAFITSTNVIMVPFITWLLLKRHPPLKIFLSVIICFIGMGILTYSSGIGFSFNLGDSLTLLCAFLFACHISFLGISAKKVSTVKLIFLQMVVAAVLSIPFFLLFEIRDFKITNSFTGLLAVAYLGIFSTCIAFFIQTHAQKHTSPPKTAVLLSMEAVFGSLFSILIGYDKPTFNLLAGGLIVIASIVVLEYKQDK